MNKLPLAMLCLAVVVATFGGAALAESPAGSDAQATAEATKEYTPVKVLGMQVFIDSETGQMRPPTAAEAAELSAALQQMLGAATQAAAPTMVHHEGGMLSVELDFAHMDFSVVRTLPDGSLTSECADGLEQATELMQQPAETPTESEEQ
jgi:hypothetical protein